MADAYAKLLERLRQIGHLEAIEALLDWDQETQMPPAGLEPRAETMAMVAATKHQYWTDPELGELLAAGSNGDPDRSAQIREARRTHDRAVKVPNELVRKIAHVSALAKDAWAQARRDDDFSRFAPHLTELLSLKRQEAEAIGYDDDPYDALLDEFEPGARTADVTALFLELRNALVPLVQAIAGAKTRPDFSILERPYPRAGQEKLCRLFAEEIGFDFNAGRLDVSVHPFCTSMTGRDVRLTTRYQEDFLPAALFGVLHEAGHGLYEQGLPAEQMFTPLGGAVSLGIHESQSRLWENQVGRSKPFWQRHFAAAQQEFPGSLGHVSLDQFHAAINTVAPSLIRVEADEVTYNLHIIVRFELEQDMLSQRLSVADVPEAWNAKMAEVVGIRPTNNREGCLQDVHWSMGAFGYFPTYALGNLYAAQLFAAAKEAVGDLDENIRQGNHRPLLEWLRSNIHRHGKRYRAGELCERATGKALSIEPFMEYVERRFKPIYGLA